MRREDLIEFARRDWQSVAAMKERFWVEQKRRMTAGEALRLADDLRSAVKSRRTDWPSDEDRRSDLAMHTRVSESLQDNGTESDVLQRSVQRALHRDHAARRITNPDLGPLFAGAPADDDLASGTIYILRSKSDDPIVAAHRDVLHKIGVTGSKIDARVANARFDPTFLLADVDVVATYELYNVNRVKLENLIHRVFGPAQLDIEIKDRFGNPVRPREWFLVPLSVIDEAVNRIKDGSITEYVYDPAVALLTARKPSGSAN